MQPGTLHIERKQVQSIISLNKYMCIFFISSLHSYIFFQKNPRLPVLEQNNMERKLHLKTVYVTDGAPGLMTEKKYCCPRNEHPCTSFLATSPVVPLTSRGLLRWLLTSCICSAPHSTHHDKDRYFSSSKRTWKIAENCIL